MLCFAAKEDIEGALVLSAGAGIQYIFILELFIILSEIAVYRADTNKTPGYNR